MKQVNNNLPTWAWTRIEKVLTFLDRRDWVFHFAGGVFRDPYNPLQQLHRVEVRRTVWIAGHQRCCLIAL
jgi:hypothetical protein